MRSFSSAPPATWLTKIFPALQGLIQRGNLDIPIIGVAREGWTADQLRERARDSLKDFGGVDADAFASLSALLQYIDIEASESNYFRFKLSPQVVISAGTQVKQPGDEMRGETVELVARNTPADEHSPYERLLGDALHGDNSLFTSDASVEAA